MSKYNIAELAELGGVSRRTVRYYVQRALIPAPTGTGRGRHYEELHLQTLIRVRQAQESGVPLSQISEHEQISERGESAAQGGPSMRCRHSAEAQPAQTPPTVTGPAETLPGETWRRYGIAEGAELHLRGLSLDQDDSAALAALMETIIEKNRRKQS